MASADIRAQDIRPNLRDDKTVIESLEDAVDRRINAFDEILGRIRSASRGVRDRLSEYSLERRLEHQIEGRLNLALDDDVVSSYLAESYGLPRVSADVTFISDDRTIAHAVVKYDTRFEGAKIYKQYEFSVQDRSLRSISSSGRAWAEIYGRQVEVGELYSFIRLDKAFNDAWGERAESFESENPGYRIVYSKNPEAFRALKAFAGNDFNQYGNPVVVDTRSWKRAQVGLSYQIIDDFGNPLDGITHLVVEEYRQEGGDWSIKSTIYDIPWKDGLAIGTEENAFERVPAKAKAMEWLKRNISEFRDYVKK